MALVGVAVGGALGLVAWLIPWLPEPASKEAGAIDNAYWFVTIVCVLIFAVVAGVSVYAVWKFRVPPGDLDDGSPIHGHTGLEIVWTAVPAVLVTAIAVYSGVALAQAEDIPADHRVIEVTAVQFAWSFTYPDVKLQNGQPLTSGELVLPLDEPVELRLTSKDVIHSFWVPQWRMKQDAVRGITTRTVVTPTKTGTFPVICTELCGLGHAVMRAQARVLSAGQFRGWIREQRRLAAEGASIAGKDLFVAQCGSCHVLADAGTTQEVGPNLDENLRGKDEDYIRQSILEPNATIAEGYQPDVMPQNYGEILTDQQIDGLVEYLLESVEGGGG
jgi:cytochrome c oxidase subunit 2